MSSKWDPQQQEGKGEGGGDQQIAPQKGGKNVWLMRILVGGTILTIGTLAMLAFGAIAIPTVLLGGGLLLLVSPLLIGGAVLTSPIWVPLVGLTLTVPPILGTIAVAFITFVLGVYWFWNFVRSSKTREAAEDLKEGMKEAAYCVQHRVYDTCHSAQQAGQQARQRAQESSSS
ncbi:hypothetical protein KFL_004380040 [Klebsormidium nitens]|uniref:Oleosin n=1 Tax=Klebsormidium nitens TaxID=105231 RepID=A0A1Y1IC50_KLENI|nr:hypothetical protein KFL_004380040 [Klebsormidium nitens]|eukprot:GAQ88544.1 hypothetical protein KFL_004380040 [Klebsormidium nitens]